MLRFQSLLWPCGLAVTLAACGSSASSTSSAGSAGADSAGADTAGADTAGADTSPGSDVAQTDDTSLSGDAAQTDDLGAVDDTSTTDDVAQTEDTAGGGVCAPVDVPCIDQSIQTLVLFDTPSTGKVVEEGNGGGEFSTWIDATAGGLNPTMSYVYAKFTDTGLETVAIGDEDAFDSADWDIAVRRFVIRMNSGVSGPSCVTVARTKPGTTFEGLTAVPADLIYRTEQYFTGDACEYVTDTSGIESPGTATVSFWEYTSCVKMTGNVYVVQTAAGRHVKLQVLSYYLPEVQTACDTTGALPSGSSGGGNIRIRWALLD